MEEDNQERNVWPMILLKNIVGILNKYKFTFILLILFLILINYQRLNDIYFKFAYLNIVLVFFLFFFVSKIKVKVVALILGGLLSILLTADFVCGFVYNIRMNEHIVSAMLASSLGESMGMLRDFVIPLILIAGVVFILVYKSIKEFRGAKLSFLKGLFVFFTSFILFGFFSALSEESKYRPDVSLQELFKLTTVKFRIAYSPAYEIVQIYAPRMSIVYSDIFSLLYYIKDRSYYRQYLNTERQLPPEMQFVGDGVEKVFLVIGESASPVYFSLFGYPVKTTPFLDSLYADTTALGKVCFFPGIASSVFTKTAVTFMLSPQNAMSEQEVLFQSKNLVEMANEAGYETVWISSQKLLSPYEGYIPIIASQTAHRAYNFQQRGGEFRYEDLELIPIIDRYLVDDKKQLFFIHLEGSHRAFEQRYDKVDKEAISGDSDIDKYNRTIHHTDRLLEAIYDLMPDNSLLCYVSDHGEDPTSAQGRLSDSNEGYKVPIVFINKSKEDVENVALSYFSSEIESINNANIYYIISEFIGYTVAPDKKEELRKQSKYVRTFSAIEAEVATIDNPTEPLNQERIREEWKREKYAK